MNYIAHLFLNHLPLVEREVRYVGGEKQECLIIPTKINQLKKSSRGNWILELMLIDEPPNEKLITHTVKLSYTSKDEADKARMQSYYNRSQCMGRVRVHDRTPSKKIDRTNKATDLQCDGIIVLSDIPKRMIFRNAENDNRYIEGLTFKAYGDSNVIYTGSICLDDIPRDFIRTNPDTGKKYINARFKKMDKLDPFFNTHHLVVTDEQGTEIEIGRFKEWKRAGIKPAEQSPQEERHDTTITPRPTPKSIDGIRF